MKTMDQLFGSDSHLRVLSDSDNVSWMDEGNYIVLCQKKKTVTFNTWYEMRSIKR